MVCSFCKCPGHNVSSCKDSSMLAIQLDSIYIISRMICMAYLKEDLPLTLHENMEMWLSELDLDHLKYILNYLKKNTSQRLTGSLTSKTNVVRNILNIVFYVCEIEETYAFIPPSVSIFTLYLSSGRLVEVEEEKKYCLLQLSRIADLDYRNSTDPNMQELFKVLIEGEVLAFHTPPTFTNPRVEFEDCPICYEPLKEETIAKLNCSHSFCITCVNNCIDCGMMNCSMCRTPITTISAHF